MELTKVCSVFMNMTQTITNISCFVHIFCQLQSFGIICRINFLGEMDL